MRRIAVVAVSLLMVPSLLHAEEWWERLKVSGDLRMRHEFIGDESEDEDRTRWKLRARLMLEARLDESWSAGIRLSSGADDPVSTNQTMTDGFSTKEIGLDLAYFEYRPEALKGIGITGGKMKLPFRRADKTELMWDSDLNPEGLAATLDASISGSVELFLGGGFFWVAERSSGDDSWLAGVQGGIGVKPEKNVSIMLGAGYYDYQGAEDMPAFFDDTDGSGNSVVPDGERVLYVNDYNEFELLGEFGIKKDGVSFKAYGNYVRNIAADSLDTGYLFGGSIGCGKGKGSFKIYVNYRKLEADAVIGAFTDSDFRGGGTDGKGLETGFALGLAEKASFDLTWFMNEKGIESNTDYTKVQADIQIKF